jgi:uncharacterized membrane protein
MSTEENPATAISAPLGEVQPVRSRIQSVDALRGGIMILMALDHIRDYINSSAMSFLPTDLSRTTAALFFTRWITHFCAPVFAFTAGIGAFLWLRRGRTKAQLSRFLLTRGLWLVFLELTVVRFVMFLNVRFANSLVILIVFWMLGLCMVFLAALIHLPIRWLAVLSLVMIATHNLLDPVQAAQFGRAAWIWDVLHQQGLFRVGSVSFATAYPLIPWIGVMAAGYCLGPVLQWEPPRRRRFLLTLGGAMVLAFILLRALNVYGDPARWSAQRSPLFTLLSWLNCTKYPPSLLFLLMTLGPALTAMAWLERSRFNFSNPLIIFGRVPFFYFVVHLAVIHALAILLGWIRYGAKSFLLLPPPSMGSPLQAFPPGYGYSLWTVYVVWLVVLLLMYPACRWYARLKQRRRDWWLSYL